MKILLVNDDGINSERLHDLALRLAKYGDLTICAPESQRSAYSHSIDIVNFNKNSIKEIPGEFRTFIHKNTPADGVRYMYTCFNETFDYVFSGVNDGYNLGVDISYSGTVGAALEGAINNCKSVAISAGIGNVLYKEYIDGILKYLFTEAIYPYKGCLNVNFPRIFNSDLPVYAPMALSYSKPALNSDLVMCKKNGYITITKIGLDRTIKD